MKVGVLSDTHAHRHDELPDWIREAFRGVACILHAGDIEDPGFLKHLAAIAPVHAVRGNMDRHAGDLPSFLFLKLGGGYAVMAHRFDEALRHLDREVILLVHGHTHIPEMVQEEGYLILNPGSPFRPRGGHEPSVAVLTIHDRTVRAEFKYSPSDADR